MTVDLAFPSQNMIDMFEMFLLISILSVLLCNATTVQWQNLIQHELNQPEAIPQTTDCAFRRLAQEFAFINLPWLNGTGERKWSLMRYLT